MNGYISVNRIADDLAEHPLLRDISLDRILNYMLELIRVVGCPKLYIDKVASVLIKNHRGELPCDFMEVIQVMGENCVEYVGATDNFLEDDSCCKGNTGIPSYRILGRVIISSKDLDVVKVAYRAVATDEDGFPMIPDNAAFIRAVEAYIKLKRFEILFDMSKINQAAFQNAQQDYCWCVGQATADFNMPSYDEMETLTNIWHNLIPRVSEHRNGFASMHNKEYLRAH